MASKRHKRKIRRISRGITQSFKEIDAQEDAARKMKRFSRRRKIPVIGRFLAKRALK